MPSVGKNLVHRPNLFDKLDEVLNHKLILISAPDGYGKTNLICDWIQQKKIATAWFSLNKGDNDSVDFEYLSFATGLVYNVIEELLTK
jgi:LuxR family maltose regulon positive regulatory protein